MGQYKLKERPVWIYRFMKDGQLYKEEGFKTKGAAKDAEEAKRWELKHHPESGPSKEPLKF